MTITSNDYHQQVEGTGTQATTYVEYVIIAAVVGVAGIGAWYGYTKYKQFKSSPAGKIAGFLVE